MVAVASSDPGSRIRTDLDQVNCATVAVSVGGAVRDTKADSATRQGPSVRQGRLDVAGRAAAVPGGRADGRQGGRREQCK